MEVATNTGMRCTALLMLTSVAGAAWPAAAQVSVPFAVAAAHAEQAEASPSSILPAHHTVPEAEDGFATVVVPPSQLHAADPSYSHEILIGDAAAGSLVGTATLLFGICFLGSVEAPEHFTCPIMQGALWAGVAAFVLPSPVIHVIHARPGAALAALLLRGLPIAAIAFPPDGTEQWLPLAAFFALLAAPPIDWFVLADPAPATTRTDSQPLGWRPALYATGSGGGVRIAGSF
jgi:hypothetical protein